MIATILAMAAALFGGDEPKKGPAAAVPQGEQAAKLSAAELKKLEEQSIFAPYKKVDVKKDPVKEPKKDPEPVKPPAPKKLSVTGFYKDDTDGAMKVIIEDRVWKETKYVFNAVHTLKVGEDVAGGKVVEIRIDSFDHQVGEKKVTYKLGAEIEVPGSVSQGPTKPAEGAGTGTTETKPTEAKSADEKLKELRERNKNKKRFNEDDGGGDEMQPKKK